MSVDSNTGSVPSESLNLMPSREKTWDEKSSDERIQLMRADPRAQMTPIPGSKAVELAFSCMQEVYIPAAGYQKGRIIEVSIKRYNISYFVEYFLNGEIKSVWLYDEEISASPDKNKGAGFNHDHRS